MFTSRVATYLKELRALRESSHTTDELSFHGILQAFLETVAADLQLTVRVVHEPRRVGIGRPDFTLLRGDFAVGYIEAEAFGVSLDNLDKDSLEQVESFRSNLDNFLLTNFLEFRLFAQGQEIGRALLPSPLQQSRLRLSPATTEDLAALLSRFLEGSQPRIGSPKELAEYLARRTRQLRREALTVLQSTDNSELHEPYTAFRHVLLPELKMEEFADLYAQTITYGLFAARCFAPLDSRFTRARAADLIPSTNPFLRRLFQRVAAHDLDERIAWIADEIASLLESADMEAILAEFGKGRGKEDPVVHFYETFLAAYDPKQRELRGVYYTPEPVVHYIVRSVHRLLQKELGISLGLADERALLLDPACGTGSFLYAAVNLIHEEVIKRFGTGIWPAYVDAKLLPRVFGFELLVAPYAVAHLKLGLQLQSLGYTVTSGRRLGVYLTNTLEEEVKSSQVLFGQFIAQEANEAASVKREKPVLVVLGNPPYSGHSANRSWRIVRQRRGNQQGEREVAVKILTWIGQLMEDYKEVDGQPLGERNPKWLQNDYVKFIRFAEWRIEQTGKGVIGYITDHGYLDNPTFRGVRYHLLKTFSVLYVYNLHGNARRRERAPDGAEDQNVFDIQQGVAIILAVKRDGATEPASEPRLAQVYYADLWGRREDKYDVLASSDIDTTTWIPVDPKPPLYLFVPHDASLEAEYIQGWRLRDIFEQASVGITTARDRLTIHWTPEQVWTTAVTFSQLAPEDARERFALGADAQDWSVDRAQQDLKVAGVPGDGAKRFITPILYRPFDIRYTLYTGRSHGFHCRPRQGVMRHLLNGNNLALIAPRRLETAGHWCHSFVSRYIVDHVAVSGKVNDTVFPLYRMETTTPTGATVHYQTTFSPLVPNFRKEFLAALGEALGRPVEATSGLPQGLSAEDVLGYIYAIMWSTAFRERYAEFLRQDYPRIPLTTDVGLFSDLALLGRQLIALHTLDVTAAPILQQPISHFPISGTNTIDRVTYDEANERVMINTEQYFDGIPAEVWTFEIGGYQVCEKWLEDRRGQTLGADTIIQYTQIVTALAETIRLQGEIDDRLTFPLPEHQTVSDVS